MVWQLFLRHMTQSNLRLSDYCSRLNSTWTVVILIFFSGLTFFLHQANDPVSCFTPIEFNPAMTTYANKVCWENNFYYLFPSFDHDVPKYYERTERLRKSQFRWIPLFLLLQALLFKLPDIVLLVGQGLVGFRFTKILGLTDGYQSLNMTDRTQMGRRVGRYLKIWINSTVFKGCPWGLLTLLFLFTKLLYFINVVTQLSVMNSVLKAENQLSFGAQMVYVLLSNTTSGSQLNDVTFPRIFLCDFKMRKLSNVQHYSVQCLFSHASYYEMMFVFLWVWLVVVTAITALSGVFQLIVVLVPIFRKRYMKRYLDLSEEVSPLPTDMEIGKFAGTEITEDGVLVLKAIGEASSEHLVRDAVIYIWQSTHPQQSHISMGQHTAPGHQVHIPPGQQIQVPPGHLAPPVYNAGQNYGGSVLTEPPSAPQSLDSQQVRYRAQTGGSGAESIPLMVK